MRGGSVLRDAARLSDHLPAGAGQPGREVTALLQPHSLAQHEFPHSVVRSECEAQSVTAGPKALRHVDVEAVRGEGYAVVDHVSVPVLPGLPVLPHVAHRHKEDVAGLLPGAETLEGLSEGGAVIQSPTWALAEVDCYLGIVSVSLVTAVYL